MPQCIFDVRSDIPSLVEANEEPGGVVVSYDAWAGSAAKRFARVKCNVKDGRHNCKFADLVGWLTRQDDHTYEIISKDKPARLFFDVEWPGDGQVKAADPLSTLLTALDVYCYGSSVFAKRVVLSCRRPNKQSFRVVFPDAVFKSVCGDMKFFVLGFVRWLVEEHASGASLTYQKKMKNGKIVPMTVLVTAVYASNQNVRMLGQSRATDKKLTPVSMEDPAADITDAMVQHPRWIRASVETSAEIDSVIEKRRPANRAYPAVPPRQSSLMQRQMPDYFERLHSRSLVPN